MIYIDFLSSPEGLVTGFRVAGHSDYAQAGSDIVCAAVSSAVYMTINTVTDVLGVSPTAMRVEEGEAFFRVTQKEEPLCRDLFSGLRIHLKALEEQYPQNMKVSYLEVS